LIPEHLRQKVDDFIECNSDLMTTVVGDKFEHGPGLVVRSDNWDTTTHINWEALAKHTIPVLRAACAQGKDVQHITRVTGYFSFTEGFNKGKAGELKDRYRSRDLG
jgi:hypothetical protein